MKKQSATCPSCGSDNVFEQREQCTAHLTLGSDFSYEKVNYKCEVCEEEGDFLAETDENYSKAQKKAEIAFAKKIVQDMNDVGISMAMFERVFELPSRTLTRWKNGDFSASSLALLRIVSTYPWIIEVAEHRFKKPYAINVAITAASNMLLEIAKKNNSLLNDHNP